MLRSVSSAFVLALSVAAAAFGTGCAGNSDSDVTSPDNALTAASAHDFEGTIGNLKVYARLDVQGAKVTGSYFYADKTGNGDSLVLDGSYANGKLSLTEKVNGAGAVTGNFEATAAGGGLNGSWQNGSTKLPLVLKPISALKTVTRKYSAKAAKPTGEYARQCSLDAEVLEVFGLDAKVEKAMADALKVDPLDRDAQGQCDGDIRSVFQTVEMSAKGFLTVHVSTEFDGGAHPENESDYFNFDTKSGANVGPNDIFAAGSEAKVKALVEAAIKSGNGKNVDGEQLDPEMMDEFEQQWNADTKLANIQMGITEKGLTIDMGNNYPHVVLALAPLVTLPWAQVKPLMKAGSPAAVMAQ